MYSPASQLIAVQGTEHRLIHTYPPRQMCPQYPLCERRSRTLALSASDVNDIELVEVGRLVPYPSKVVVHLGHGKVVQPPARLADRFDPAVSVPARPDADLFDAHGPRLTSRHCSGKC